MALGAGGRGLTRRRVHRPRWPTEVLGPGDRDRPDVARCVSPDATPDRRAYRLQPAAARPRSCRTCPTLSRRAETLEVPRPKEGSEPVHLLADSTGLRLFGPGGWLEDKHGSKRRRAWRMLHLATDADTGHIVASVLTSRVLMTVRRSVPCWAGSPVPPCVTGVVARLGPRNEGARGIESGTIRTSIQGSHRRTAAAAGERSG